VRDYLQSFVKFLAKNTENAYWLFCVPLLHFLWDKCKPFEAPSDNIEHTAIQPVWWGVEEYEGAHDNFKGRSRWNM